MRYFKLALGHLISKEVEKELKDGSKSLYVDALPEPDESQGKIDDQESTSAKEVTAVQLAYRNHQVSPDMSARDSALEFTNRSDRHFVPYQSDPDLPKRKNELRVVDYDVKEEL